MERFAFIPPGVKQKVAERPGEWGPRSGLDEGGELQGRFEKIFPSPCDWGGDQALIRGHTAGARWHLGGSVRTPLRLSGRRKRRAMGRSSLESEVELDLLYDLRPVNERDNPTGAPPLRAEQGIGLTNLTDPTRPSAVSSSERLGVAGSRRMRSTAGKRATAKRVRRTGANHRILSGASLRRVGPRHSL